VSIISSGLFVKANQAKPPQVGKGRKWPSHRRALTTPYESLFEKIRKIRRTGILVGRTPCRKDSTPLFSVKQLGKALGATL